LRVGRELLIGLDVGTTRACALVVDGEGAVRGRAGRALDCRFPAAGWVEQDPTALWEESRAALREALAEAGASARDVAGLGVATQRSTVLAWDARSGEPLAPAIGWQDQRTAARAAELHARGVPMPVQASATKLEWLLQNDARVAAAAREGRLRFGTPDVWLTDRLTGGSRFVTDPSCASTTGLFDAGSGAWMEPVAALFGVPCEALPAVVDTAEVVAETPGDLLGAPVPVAARAGDQQSASFAQGVHRAGEAKLTLGTAAMLEVHTGDSFQQPGPGAHALALWRLPETSSQYCVESSVHTAGAVVEWLTRIGLLPDVASLDRVAREVESAEGVVFVPALQGLGTPYLDDGARGLLGGITRGSRAAHVVRAAVDGLTQRCIDLCESAGLGAEPLRVDGGLAQSDLLLQTLADFGGRSVHRAREFETTALGAAQLAGLAVGAFASLAQCRETIPAPLRFDPGLDEGGRSRRRRRWAEAVARARTSPG
jgi:glycerol kinase